VYPLTLELQHHYAKGSSQRADLTAALETLQKNGALKVPLVVGGKEVGFVVSPWMGNCALTITS
jgi:hypothetical protein